MVYWSVIFLQLSKLRAPTPARWERKHSLTCLSVQVMTSHRSSRRSPWWRSASTKTLWPTSAVTTGAACFQPVLFMCGTANIVGGVSYGVFIQYFPTLSLDLGGMAIQQLVLLLQQNKVAGLIPGLVWGLSVLSFHVLSGVQLYTGCLISLPLLLVLCSVCFVILGSV